MAATVTDWADRRCERCQVRSVGVQGPDPRLCDDCQRQEALARDNDRSERWEITHGEWGHLACQPCRVEGRIEIAGRCPVHDGGEPVK